MHIFYVQGGGLGHLTRVDKLITTLNIKKGTVIIITPSVFTNYFNDYQFVKLSWSEDLSDWIEQIENVIKSNPTTTFYIDTFPSGIKGELISIYSTFPYLKYIYIARVLKWETYLKAMPNQNNIVFSQTIVLEPLYDNHLDWIKTHSKTYLNLTLKSNSITPIPFIDTPYVMVVHSGGKADVLRVCNQAIDDYKADSNIHIIVFTQVDIQLKKETLFINKNVFPVTQYYEDAIKIYTAAGFNSVQELRFFKDKHIIIPLKKLYDDQFFRVSNKMKN
ncbi:hypothetical protein [uncultured Algibacter sp.]|uniref:hypothetical protein n=1 Tax=uncultured Algibacter sp. TaxID=298659 RepID=UPI00321776D2